MIVIGQIPAPQVWLSSPLNADSPGDFKKRTMDCWLGCGLDYGLQSNCMEMNFEGIEEG